MSVDPSVALSGLSPGDVVAVVSPTADPILASVVSATKTRVQVGTPAVATAYRRDTGETYPASAGDSRLVAIKEVAADLARVDRLRLCAVRRIACLDPAALTDGQVAGVLGILRKLLGPGS